MIEDLKSIVQSPHDSRSIIKMASAISTLCETVSKLEKRVKALENKRRSSRKKKS